MSVEIMTAFCLVPACLLTGSVLAWYFTRRKLTKNRHWLVVYTEQRVFIRECKEEAEGVQVDGAIYPTTYQKTIPNGDVIHVLLIRDAVYLEHKALDTHRSKILKGRIHKKGGELTEIIQIAFIVIVIASSLMTTISTIAYSGSAKQAEIKLEQILHEFDKGMKVRLPNE